MFTQIQNFAKKHTFLTFLVLTYVLSWWPWLWRGYVDSLGMGMFPWGPSIAAIITTALVGGKGELKTLLHHYVHARFPVKWYVLAIGLPIVVTSLAALLNVFVIGAAAPSADKLAMLPQALVEFPIVFLVSGAQEELGWRGFALERLQKKYPALGASLLVTVMGVLWHIPLFLVGDIQWPDVLVMLAGYTVMSYLYNRSRGSVLLMMLLHATNNTFSGAYVSNLFGVTADKVTLALMVAAVWSVVAIAVVIIAGPAKLGRYDEEEETPVNIDIEPYPVNA